ncbi:hypothetical protein [Paraburkholderia sp.]|uniref:hypothetical protein n=1 Tax=Paraburkholderia sp. TaxID=1926495 RepID=UPI002F429094
MNTWTSSSLLPAGYQDWCEQVLEDDGLVGRRHQFQLIRNARDFLTALPATHERFKPI